VHNYSNTHIHMSAKFWRVGSVNHRAILLLTHSPKASGFFIFQGKQEESRRAMSETNTDEASCQGWRAVVPATSANLGCAFDCGGLALKLYLKALFIPSQTSELTFQYQGRTPERFPLDSSNLVLRALRFGAERLGAQLPGGDLAVESAIPIGVGLGSSAASVIAGLLLATRLSGHKGQPASTEQLLRWAEELEGHLDNAAAAYHGGLVFVLTQGVDHPVTVKTAFPESIHLVIVSPSVAVATHEARGTLPQAYTRADTVHTLQRTALLAATCFSGRFDLFPELFDDRLHHPYREKLVPGMESCLRLRHRGLLGTAISGSGSSVIAFVSQNEAGDETEIARALQECFAKEGTDSEVLFTSADNQGASVTREAVPLAAKLGSVLQRVGRTG
jgi:homoserine kinase